jgi:hypothetical protein
MIVLIDNRRWMFPEAVVSELTSTLSHQQEDSNSHQPSCLPK